MQAFYLHAFIATAWNSAVPVILKILTNKRKVNYASVTGCPKLQTNGV
jgi:hypothetical protein